MEHVNLRTFQIDLLQKKKTAEEKITKVNSLKAAVITTAHPFIHFAVVWKGVVAKTSL